MAPLSQRPSRTDLLGYNTSVTTRDTGILHYEVSGKGPVIVLLHGYLCSGKYWDNIRTRLERDHTVVTVDLLGFGKSPKPRKSSYDYIEHLAWIRRTLEQAHITGPVLLAGHSMGALLALRYGVLYPDKTNRLVLMNLPLFAGKKRARKELAGTNLLYRAGLYWRFDHVFVPVMRTAYGKKLTHLALPQTHKGMEEYLFASSAISRGRSLRKVIESQTASDDLRQLTIPTTILAGRGERPAYLENVERVQKYKNITVILANTGHHTPREDPELIVNILQQK
jgi:pimeloyl-ACP methyl ester carboxylesterase